MSHPFFLALFARFSCLFACVRVLCVCVGAQPTVLAGNHQGDQHHAAV
jgi:hypothetical protein